MAKQDGSDQSDLTRFKVQELHTLNHFYNELNCIEYKSNAKLSFPKSIKHDILMETNTNAFQETYNLDKQIIKSLIGNLNWHKFADRIA